MKKYIQKLAVALIACAGFASCADEFDATDHATYPAEAPGLGTWVADQTATSGPFTKGFLYELNITLSAAGDTVYNITSVSTPYNQLQVGVNPDGSPQFLPAGYPICSPGGKLQWYDSAAGTAYLEFDQTEEGNLLGVGLTPARAYVIYNRSWDKLTVDMDFYAQGAWYSYQDNLGNGKFTLTKAAHPSFICGYWLGQDEAGQPYIFYLTYEQQLQIGSDDDGQPITTPIEGQCIVGNAQNYCLFDYDKTTGTGTVTTVPVMAGQEAETYTLQYNEIGQLTYNNGSETIILDRVAY